MNRSAIDHLCSFLREKFPDELWDFSTTLRLRSPTVLSREGFKRLDPDCGAVGCAVGAASVCFGVGPYGPDVSGVLGIPLVDADVLFGMGSGWIYDGKKTHSQVTRHDVANALQRYAEEGAWWRE